MLKKITTITSILVLSAGALFAQATKVGIIDMQQVIQNFSKTAEVTKTLEAQASIANENDKKAVAELNELREKVQKADKEFQNPMLSEAKKEQVRKDAFAVIEQIKKQEQQLLETRKSIQNSLQAQRVEETNKLLKDITPRIKTVANTRGCDLVLNSSAAVFLEPQADLTKDVIDLLAKDFPAKEKETPILPAETPTGVPAK